MRQRTVLSLIAILCGVAMSACAEKDHAGLGSALSLKEASFESLSGWQDEDHTEALETFVASCGTAMARSEALTQNVPELCEVADGVAPGGARAFFERYFTLHRVEGGGTSLFTGYFEPVLQGARQRQSGFTTALRTPPRDLVQVRPQDFEDGAVTETVWGRVVEGRLIPYFDRAQIENGAADETAEPLVWLSDPVDAFFAHIQGSARVELRDGSEIRVGYAAKNGQPYTAIGSPLVARGEIAEEEVSMQAIRAWLKAHPDEMPDVMALNKSYIFFEERPVAEPEKGPIGALGVALTPRRSLAVDPALHTLGLPYWVETEVPDPDGAEARAFARLMVAQDVGSAIKGAVRGDIFFGSGAAAGETAGRMKAPGALYVLLPKGALFSS